MKTALAALCSALALAAPSVVSAKIWTFETKVGVISVNDTTDHWENVSASVSQRTMGGCYCFGHTNVLNPGFISILFTGINDTAFNYPEVSVAFKPDWAGYSHWSDSWTAGTMGEDTNEIYWRYTMAWAAKKDFYGRYEALYPGAAAPVPEPATYAMMGLGLAALGIAARRRRKA